MALEDTDKLDGVAYDAEERSLVMLLTDAWGWGDDEAATHLGLLQDKVNAYATFAQSGQWRGMWPDAEPERFVIQLSIKDPYGAGLARFLDRASAQLAPAGVSFDVRGTTRLEDAGRVDGMTLGEDGTLDLLMEDALGWQDEERHLGLLADKIGAYAGVVQSGQWRDAVGGRAGDVRSFRIVVEMALPYGERCRELFASVAEQLGALDVPVRFAAAAPGDPA